MQANILTVSIEEIRPNKDQPRRRESFDEESLKSLAESIKSVGLLQPPVVQKREDHYEIIAGERRYLASKLAGLKEIPVILKSFESLKASLSALIENIQREDLNPIDTALAIEKMIEEEDLSHERVAGLLGMARTSLSNQLRLLSLSKMIQKALIEKKITTGHAKVLLSLETDKERHTLFQIIMDRGLSVRAAEEYVKNKKKSAPVRKKTTPLKKNIFLQQIQETLQEKLGTKVTFSGDESAGVLGLHYYNLSDLNRLLNEIGYSEDD